MDVGLLFDSLALSFSLVCLKCSQKFFFLFTFKSPFSFLAVIIHYALLTHAQYIRSETNSLFFLGISVCGAEDDGASETGYQNPVQGQLSSQLCHFRLDACVCRLGSVVRPLLHFSAYR